MPLFGRFGRKAAELPTFAADPEVAAEAARVAPNFCRWASKHFGVELDFSDESIQLIESIAAKIDEEIRAGRASPDPKWAHDMAPGFGYYIGETYLRNHGGAWGWSDLPDGVRTLAVQTKSGGMWWPAM